MSEPTYTDHLRAATVALTEASDRLAAAWLSYGADDPPPELAFARKLTDEAKSNLNTVRRGAVRVVPVASSGKETPDGE